MEQSRRVLTKSKPYPKVSFPFWRDLISRNRKHQGIQNQKESDNITGSGLYLAPDSTNEKRRINCPCILNSRWGSNLDLVINF